MEVSTSQLACYKKCKKQWYYRFYMMLDSVGFIKNLELGSYVHHLLDEFYKPTGDYDHNIAFTSLDDLANYRHGHVLKASRNYFEVKTKDLFDEEMPKYIEMRSEAEAIITRYIENCSNDLLAYSVVDTELEFSARIFTSSGRPTKDVFRGKFDMVLKDEFDTIWFMEHKTTADGIDNRFDGIELEEQLNNYFMVADRHYQDFGGGILNLIRKKAPRIPEPLKNGKSLSVDKKIDTTYELYMEAIIKYGFDPKSYTEILGILKEKGDRFFGRRIVTRKKFQINETRNEIYNTVRCIKADVRAFEKSGDDSVFFRCPTYMCKGCSYFNLCILDSKKGDVENYIAGNFIKRTVVNPELSIKE